MDKITAETPSVSKLLGDTRYHIDYYQREYRWERRQVAQLWDDLFSVFSESHQEEDERTAVETYSQYFLGPIILTQRESVNDIVDGQQRITTLLLLLIALRRRSTDEDHRASISNLVVTTRMGKHTFTVDVAEREKVMDALFEGEDIDADVGEPSAQNILDRFADIEELIDGDLKSSALSFFIDWLMYRVMVVSVIAANESDAYMIFETMNDRGLRLTAPEMLRGYLLSRIEASDDRSAVSEIWKERTVDLAKLNKEEDVDAIQAWLRSRYAETASRYVKGVAPGDYERIGNEFHRWVRDAENERLGLRKASDFANFIRSDFRYYTDWYVRLRRAAEATTEGLETLEYIASHGFTLQYMLLLASLDISDSEEVALAKIRATAAYVDILIHQRLWNSQSIGQTYLRFPFFELAKKIRTLKSIDELVNILMEEIEQSDLNFQTRSKLAWKSHKSNTVRRILARLTSFVEQGRTDGKTYTQLQAKGRKGYDIEHIMADKPERYVDQFASENEFSDERDWIGGLVLVPSGDNRSYGALDYQEKIDHYLKQNWLAASLHPSAYERNPDFRRLITESGLPFESYDRFGREELHARQQLYEQIAAQVWNVDRIRQEAGL